MSRLIATSVARAGDNVKNRAVTAMIRIVSSRCHASMLWGNGDTTSFVTLRVPPSPEGEGFWQRFPMPSMKRPPRHGFCTVRFLSQRSFFSQKWKITSLTASTSFTPQYSTTGPTSVHSASMNTSGSITSSVRAASV